MTKPETKRERHFLLSWWCVPALLAIIFFATQLYWMPFDGINGYLLVALVIVPMVCISIPGYERRGGFTAVIVFALLIAALLILPEVMSSHCTAFDSRQDCVDYHEQKRVEKERHDLDGATAARGGLFYPHRDVEIQVKPSGFIDKSDDGLMLASGTGPNAGGTSVLFIVPPQCERELTKSSVTVRYKSVASFQPNLVPTVLSSPILVCK